MQGNELECEAKAKKILFKYPKELAEKITKELNLALDNWELYAEIKSI